MTELKRNRLEIVSWVALAVGLITLLNEAHSSGEALETFKLVFSSNAGTLLGATVAFFAAAVLIALHFGDIKKILRHH